MLELAATKNRLIQCFRHKLLFDKYLIKSIFDTSLKSEPALSSAGVQQSSELVTPCKLPEKRIRLYIGYV